MSNIKLVHSGGNSVSLTTPDSNPGANRTFKLPGADGTANQTMVTDGSGAFSFQTQGYGLFHVRANQNDGDTPQTVSMTTRTKIQFKYEIADLLFESKEKLTDNEFKILIEKISEIKH